MRPKYVTAVRAADEFMAPEGGRHSGRWDEGGKAEGHVHVRGGAHYETNADLTDARKVGWPTFLNLNGIGVFGVRVIKFKPAMQVRQCSTASDIRWQARRSPAAHKTLSVSQR